MPSTLKTGSSSRGKSVTFNNQTDIRTIPDYMGTYAEGEVLEPPSEWEEANAKLLTDKALIAAVAMEQQEAYEAREADKYLPMYAQRTGVVYSAAPAQRPDVSPSAAQFTPVPLKRAIRLQDASNHTGRHPQRPWRHVVAFHTQKQQEDEEEQFQQQLKRPDSPMQPRRLRRGMPPANQSSNHGRVDSSTLPQAPPIRSRLMYDQSSNSSRNSFFTGQDVLPRRPVQLRPSLTRSVTTHQFSDSLPPEQVGTWHDLDAERERKHPSFQARVKKAQETAQKVQEKGLQKAKYAAGLVDVVAELGVKNSLQQLQHSIRR